MAQEGLNTSDTEMILVYKKDAQYVLDLYKEKLAKADEFMQDAGNRKNRKKYGEIYADLITGFTYISILRMLNIITAEERCQYSEATNKRAEELIKWFYGGNNES